MKRISASSLFVAITVMVFVFLASCNSRQNSGTPIEFKVSSTPQPRRTIREEDRRESLQFLQKGRKLIQNNKERQAIFELQRDVEINPENAEAALELARVYRKFANYNNALENYQKALQSQPNRKDALKEYSDLLKLAGKYEMAAEFYEKLVKLDPEDMDALLSYALCLQKIGKLKDAEENYRIAVEKFPNDPNPARSFAWYWFELADTASENSGKYYENAASYFEKAYLASKEDDVKWEYKFYQAKSYYRKWKITKKEEDKARALNEFTEYIKSSLDLPWKSSAEMFIDEMREGE